MPLVTLVVIHSQIIGHTDSKLYIKVSPDVSYISMTYLDSNDILVWKIADWSLLATQTASVSNIKCHVWSGDSRFLFLFLYTSNKVEVYDRDTSFTIATTITTSYSGIMQGYYVTETNIIIGLDPLNCIFGISLFFRFSNKIQLQDSI